MNPVVISGGAMLMMGLRETTEDIDIQLKPDTFLRIAREEGIVPSKDMISGNVIMKMTFGNVEFVTFLIGDKFSNNSAFGAHGQVRPMYIPNTIDVLSCKETMVMDGVRISTPTETLRLKKRLNREKDQPDIIVLEAFLDFRVECLY